MATSSHAPAIGTWLAVISGGGGLLGVYLGGELASRYAANNERLQLTVMAATFVIFALIKAAVFLAPTYYVAFAALALSSLSNMCQGPLLATVQTLVRPHMRAMSVALILFFSNLIGVGLGPLATGVLSDALRVTLGEESLRYSLAALCAGYFWAAWYLWRASRTVVRDLAAATLSEEDRLSTSQLNTAAAVE